MKLSKKGSLRSFYRSNSQALGTNINAVIATDRLSFKYSGNYTEAKNYSSADNFKEGATTVGRDWIDGPKLALPLIKFLTIFLILD